MSRSSLPTMIWIELGMSIDEYINRWWWDGWDKAYLWENGIGELIGWCRSIGEVVADMD